RPGGAGKWFYDSQTGSGRDGPPGRPRRARRARPTKNENAPALCWSVCGKPIVNLRSADLGANETAVALHADFAAGQQVGHGSDGFLGVACAGTDGHDQVTEGKFLGARFQDEIVFLHWNDSF